MSAKLFAAAIVLLIGVVLASLFPRAEDSRPHEGLQGGVTLRREAAPPDLEARAVVQSSHSIPGLPSLKAVAAPSADATEPKEAATATPSSYRSALRNPPPMPAEYRMLAERERPETRSNTPQAPPTAKRKGPTDQPPRKIVHRVVDGDTLAAIADRYLGDAALADRIWQANRDRLPHNPNLLPIGVELAIPSRTAEAAPQRELADVHQPEGAITFLVPVEPPPVVADFQAR